ncbi:MAG: hypothetical protein WEE89_14915 [Gemmatimonadota bacterium]
MRTCHACLALTLLITLSASAPNHRAETLKCAPGTPVLFPNAPENVFLLDAKPVEEKLLAQLDPKSIESIEMVCATELHQVFGVEARRNGVLIFTAPGPHTALKTSLQSIVSMQQVHLAEHGVFAKTLTDLRWNDPTGLITMKLEVSEDGRRWSAAGSHRYRIKALASQVSGER